MAEQAYFTTDFFRFLRDLSRNNNREWFTENKPRYESAVLGPAVRFVQEMGPKLSEISPRIVSDARPFGGSVARIYRDTRFSKDKSPYKTAVGIHFSHESAGSSEEHLPGFFLHLAPGESMLYSGVWHPSPGALKKIRDAIVGQGPAWGRIRRAGLEIEGESYARVPAGYDQAHPFATDLKRKDFFASLSFTDAEVTGSRFGSAFVASCKKLDPLNRFVADAMQLPW